MISKILCVVLIICSLAMILAGLFGWQEPSIKHVAFGMVAFLSGLAIFFLHIAEDAPCYDDRTGRYYRFAKKYEDNPYRGYCPKPKCSRYSPTIVETHTKGFPHIGVKCEIHGCIWSDDGEPITMLKAARGWEE